MPDRSVTHTQSCVGQGPHIFRYQHWLWWRWRGAEPSKLLCLTQRQACRVREYISNPTWRSWRKMGKLWHWANLQQAWHEAEVKTSTDIWWNWYNAGYANQAGHFKQEKCWREDRMLAKSPGQGKISSRVGKVQGTLFPCSLCVAGFLWLLPGGFWWREGAVSRNVFSLVICV